jgi:hypothetical protein
MHAIFRRRLAASLPRRLPLRRPQVFEFASTSTAKVLIIGKTANIKIFPNKTSSSYLTLKFNRIEELDDDGKAVYGHAITSLAGLTPTYSTGAPQPVARARRLQRGAGGCRGDHAAAVAAMGGGGTQGYWLIVRQAS